MIKINIFLGELTDISGNKEALCATAGSRHTQVFEVYNSFLLLHSMHSMWTYTCSTHCSQIYMCSYLSVTTYALTELSA